MRSFSQFDAALPADLVRKAGADRLRSLATWAYLLLRPGMEFVRQRSNFILGWQAAVTAGAAVAEGAAAGAVGRGGIPPLGSWMILPDLTSPATQTVLPSNDALYGAAHVELDRLGPLVIHVPANLDDRYFSVAVMDAHFNNVARIGPRWTGNGATDHVLAPPGWRGQAPAGMPVIHSPTVSACLYNRMLVGYAEGDIGRVRQWQAGLSITQLSHYREAQPALDGVDTAPFVHPGLNTLTDSLQYLRVGLDHLARNPLVTGAAWLSAMIASAGFGQAVADPALRAAVEKGIGEATRMLDATLTTWPRQGGWMLPDPRLGLPNPDVLKSAAFQQFQIGSNDISESAYYFTDAAGQLLDGSGGAVHALRFAGDRLPPAGPGGYWSLTMYDERSLLVANPIDRYATRPERPGFVRDPDGGATITLAPALPDGVRGAPAGPGGQLPGRRLLERRCRAGAAGERDPEGAVSGHAEDRGSDRHGPGEGDRLPERVSGAALGAARSR